MNLEEKINHFEKQINNLLNCLNDKEKNVRPGLITEYDYLKEYSIVFSKLVKYHKKLSKLYKKNKNPETSQLYKDMVSVEKAELKAVKKEIKYF